MPKTRREFLKTTLAGATLGSASLIAAQTSDTNESTTTKQTENPNGLPRRTLGRTGESVTILGLGCAHAGIWASESETRATLDAALEGGIRYFDAAPEYTRAEVRLGPVLSPVRDEVFIVTKTYAHDAAQAEKDLTGSLERLKTDHVDLFLQHGVGLKPWWTGQEILGKDGSFEYLLKAKEMGLTRFVGMSVHAPYDLANALLDASDEWDVVQPFVNYVARAMDEVKGWEGEVLSRAHRDGLGIVAMKVLGGSPGQMSDDYDRAFRYALSQPDVACALIGAKTPGEVERALKAAREFRPLTEQEMEESILLGQKMVQTKSSKVNILNEHRKHDYRQERYA